MSLINDALKRAKQAQPAASAPPAPGPQFRPVEPAPTALRGVGLALQGAFAVIALLALLLVWQALRQDRRARPAEPVALPQVSARAPQPRPVVAESPAAPAPAAPAVAAQSAAPPAPTPARAPEPAKAAAPPAPAAPPTAAGSTPVAPPAAAAPAPVTPVAAAAPPTPSVAAVTTNLPAAAVPQAAPTNTPPAAAPAPPKPPPIRLQSIVFNPARPSAMINGKIVFVGDRLGESRVAAITPISATLVGAGQTNTLTLER